MTKCRQCENETLEIIRESIVRRGSRNFLVSWYRCSACQDVSFKYRLFPESGDTVIGSEASEGERELLSSEERPISDSRLPI